MALRIGCSRVDLRASSNSERGGHGVLDRLGFDNDQSSVV